MKSKFTKTKDSVIKSDLGTKLDLIACDLADEIISNQRSEPVDRGFGFDEKLGALKTLTSYYAMVAKVDPPEDEGNGFAKYRKEVTATGSGRGRAADGSPNILFSGEVE